MRFIRKTYRSSLSLETDLSGNALGTSVSMSSEGGLTGMRSGRSSNVSSVEVATLISMGSARTVDGLMGPVKMGELSMKRTLISLNSKC